MARKNGADAAKAKAAKQKKLLFVLLGVLVLALFYAFHTLRGSSAPAAPEPVAASTTTTASTAPPAAGATTVAATPPATPATPTATPPTNLPAPVLVAAARPAPDTGQLQSFSRFESKDPFAAQGPKSTLASPSGTATASAGAGPKQAASGSGAAKNAAQPAAPPPTSAVIAVNGTATLVASGSDFPVSTDPTVNGLFHLVGLTQKTATISVVGGSYASGAATLKLKVNQPVTLANTADGKRYTLELFPQGTAAPPAAASSSSATTGSTTP